MARIGVIGTGHIAAPMVRFLVAKGHLLTVTRRGAEISRALENSHGVTVCDATQEVLDRTDIVLLCLRPQVATDILQPLNFKKTHQIVSVMAGIDRPKLETLCAPATDMVQTIPLGFLEQGGCPLAGFGNTGLLAELFAPDNPVVPVVSEPALNAHFAICAMVPGLLDLMQTGARWLATETGDPKAAEFYTNQLVTTFLAHAKDGLAGERDALATQGTISLQMVDGLRTGGAHDALQDTLTAIGKRLNQNA